MGQALVALRSLRLLVTRAKSLQRQVKPVSSQHRCVKGEAVAVMKTIGWLMDMTGMGKREEITHHEVSDENR